MFSTKKLAHKQKILTSSGTRKTLKFYTDGSVYKKTKNENSLFKPLINALTPYTRITRTKKRKGGKTQKKQKKETKERNKKK